MKTFGFSAEFFICLKKNKKILFFFNLLKKLIFGNNYGIIILGRSL